jgi:CubicO group peptidase (beta-lactamase class C family)
MRKLLVLFFFVTSSLFAQSVQERLASLGPELRQKMEAFKVKNNLSSVAYAVVLDGKVVLENYDGYIQQETRRVADKHSVYRIASMSKSFAGVAILQLRDKGLLKLEDPVSKYIPELLGQKYSADSPEINLRHLLTHAAGFPEDNPWGDRQLGISTEEMLSMFKKGISFSTAPGENYEYSNMAFAMLGYVISAVSGMPYQTYIEKEIWAPLGMKDTYWDYKRVPKDQLVLGYRWVSGKYVPQPIEGDGAYGIMGGILTSTADFCKYMAFHQAVYENAIPPFSVLKHSSIKEMHFPWNFNGLNRRGFKGDGTVCENVSHYGYGLRLDRNCEQIDMIGHSGGLPGYGSDWKILPDYGLGIVTLTNGTYGSAALLNNEILPWLVAKAGVVRKAVPASPILQKRQGELNRLLPDWKDAEASGIFAVNFFDDYYINMLREESKAVFDGLGGVKKVHAMQADNALRGSYLIEGEKGNAKVSFTLSPENPPLIQAFSIQKVK